MPNKKYKPTTSTRRFQTVSDFNEITTDRPEKSLVVKLVKTGGRNAQGRITSRWIGGGHKRKYRIIDFKRDKFDIPAKVSSIEYDPNRSVRIALLNYADGEKRYILAPQELNVGAKVISGSEEAEIIVGNCLPLRKIPLGIVVHNVELREGAGGKLARSAGTSCQLIAKEEGNAFLRLPSGEIRVVNQNCRATIGLLGNPDHENIVIGKAGRSRWLGKNPEVRGVAMNPVDHPLGGGEGRSSGGRHPVSPWGKSSKGGRTRSNKRTDKFIVKRRKK